MFGYAQRSVVSPSPAVVVCATTRSAVADGELSIKKGEELQVLESDRSWWTVSNEHGDTGIVPIAHLCTLEKLPAEDTAAIFLSSCGHMMHSQCYTEFKDAQQKQLRRTRQARSLHGDSFCPLCGTVSNIAIPLTTGSVSGISSDEVQPVADQVCRETGPLRMRDLDKYKSALMAQASFAASAAVGRGSSAATSTGEPSSVTMDDESSNVQVEPIDPVLADGIAALAASGAGVLADELEELLRNPGRAGMTGGAGDAMAQAERLLLAARGRHAGLPAHASGDTEPGGAAALLEHFHRVFSGGRPARGARRPELGAIWAWLAHTFSSTEKAMHGRSANTAERRLLPALCRAVSASMTAGPHNAYRPEACVHATSLFIGNLIPGMGSSGSNFRPSLASDPFELLVRGSYALGGGNEHDNVGLGLLKITAVLAIAQALIRNICNESAVPHGKRLCRDGPDSTASTAVCMLFAALKTKLPKLIEASATVPAVSVLERSCSHFFRRANLFIQARSAPASGMAAGPLDCGGIGQLFSSLGGFTGLLLEPGAGVESSLVLAHAVQTLVEHWCHGYSVHPGDISLGCIGGGFFTSTADVRTMVSLPQEFSEAFHAACAARCPQDERRPSSKPALCLRCGVHVCCESQCCESEVRLLDGTVKKVGGCTAHAMRCSAGTAAFLLVKQCQVLLLDTDKKRGSTVDAPYVDSHGERDTGLRRGRPLFLDERSHEGISQMIEGNGIALEVARWTHESAAYSSPGTWLRC